MAINNRAFRATIGFPQVFDRKQHAPQLQSVAKRKSAPVKNSQEEALLPCKSAAGCKRESDYIVRAFGEG